MIAKALSVGLAIVGADASLDDDADLGLDSLQVVSLVDHLEAELGVTFDGADVTRENFRSRASLAALLARKGAA